MKEDLQKSLTKFGLSDYESRAFIVIMKSPITLKNLSKETSIPPGKISTIIKKLLEKRLVEKTTERPMKVYMKNASESVSKLIETSEEEYTNAIRTVRDEASQYDISNLQQTNLIDIGITVEENHRIQERVFLEAKKEVRQFFNSNHAPQSNRKSKKKWEDVIEESINRGIKYKAIYPLETILPQKIKELSEKEGFEIRRHNSTYPRFDIIDQTHVLIKITSTDKVLFGGVLLIRDSKFAKHLTTVFEGLWNDANKN
jgi:sugar-specific transcriptional regulator TrmB